MYNTKKKGTKRNDAANIGDVHIGLLNIEQLLQNARMMLEMKAQTKRAAPPPPPPPPPRIDMSQQYELQEQLKDFFKRKIQRDEQYIKLLQTLGQKELSSRTLNLRNKLLENALRQEKDKRIAE